jgi:hypothetical protein
MASDAVALDQTQLRAVFKALKNMDDEATAEAKRQSGALAEYARAEVIQKAQSLQSRNVAGRIAQGSKVKKSSKIGEITYGFASQKFSGGATTRDIWAVLNLDPTSTSSSLSGQAAKVEALRDGLFIQRFAGFNLR